MLFNAPLFTIVGARPVKAIRSQDGRLGIYAFNWRTGEFELDMSYLIRIYCGREDEFQVLSESDFNVYVLELKQKLGFY